MNIFKLVGSIFIDTEKADDSLSKTDKKASSLGNTLLNGVKKAGKFAVGLGTAAAAGATALVSVAKSAASTTDNIDKMSQKIGISRQAYQELDFICSQSGASVDNLKAGMKTLTNQMQMASEGSTTATAAFEELGLSWTDSSGALKDQETMMWEAFSALQSCEDQTKKAALATDLFGKAGTELMPMLNGAEGSIESMKKQAHDLGLVMGDEAVDAGVKLTDTIDQSSRAFSAIVTNIGVLVMPIVQKLLEWVLANMPIIKAVFNDVFNVINSIVKSAANVIESLMPTIKKVFTFISELWNSSLKPILTNITSFLSNVFAGNFTGAFKNIINIVKSVFSGLIAIVKSPLNSVIRMINNFISGLNKIKIPSWVPGVGGKGINISKIPLLAKGGNILESGQAIVGEAGPELIDLPAGATVRPLSNGQGSFATAKTNEQLDRLLYLLSEFMPQVLSGMERKVVLSTGETVGAFLPYIDSGLSEISDIRERSGV